jgi:predicted kinase
VAERARRRERRGGDASDATAEIAVRQLEEFEPLDEVAANHHVQLRTDRDEVGILDDLEAMLDARLARGAPAGDY